MRNAEYVRNIRIHPSRPDGNEFTWGVDIAFPTMNEDGSIKYMHMSENGTAKGFQKAHNALVKYVESI